MTLYILWMTHVCLSLIEIVILITVMTLIDTVDLIMVMLHNVMIFQAAQGQIKENTVKVNSIFQCLTMMRGTSINLTDAVGLLTLRLLNVLMIPAALAKKIVNVTVLMFFSIIICDSRER